MRIDELGGVMLPRQRRRCCRPRPQAQTLKVVMHSDVKIVDPIWTTAYIVRNHGYMVYDTLLAVDDKLAVKPQMVESWKVSDDKLTYTFTLRDGLKFHDGAAGDRRGLHRLDQALGVARRDGPEADGLHQGPDGRRRQDLHAHPQGALRPGARIARQAQLAGALHHAQARRRDAGQHADQGVHRLRPVRLPRATCGGRARSRSTTSSRTTSRAPSRPRPCRAARTSMSTASSGSTSPIRRPRPTPC